MPRSSRFVQITALGVLSACTGAASVPVEPAVNPSTKVSAEHAGGIPNSTTLPTEGNQPASLPTLNPKDVDGRTIFMNSDGDCYVVLPFQDDQSRPPPGMRRPTQAHDCPEEMLAEPTWKACANGVIKIDPNTAMCTCFISGNPPPAPSSIHCPQS